MAEVKFRISHHAGLTSCLTVRLRDICIFRDKYNVLPEALDCSDLFLQYRDVAGENVNEKLMAPYHPDNTLPNIEFRDPWQFKWYKKIDITNLSKLARVVCCPSDLVMNKTKQFLPMLEGRTAILYRGNDKQKEIRATPYEAMVKMARETNSSKFIVQTDEEEFYIYFKERFPDSIAFNEIPRIKKNIDSFVLPEQGKRVEFAINFLAALISLSQCQTACITTGNVGLWFTIFRGNMDGVWQYNGKYQKFRKS